MNFFLANTFNKIMGTLKKNYHAEISGTKGLSGTFTNMNDHFSAVWFSVWFKTEIRGQTRVHAQALREILLCLVLLLQPPIQHAEYGIAFVGEFVAIPAINAEGGQKSTHLAPSTTWLKCVWPPPPPGDSLVFWLQTRPPGGVVSKDWPKMATQRQKWEIIWFFLGPNSIDFEPFDSFDFDFQPSDQNRPPPQEKEMSGWLFFEGDQGSFIPKARTLPPPKNKSWVRCLKPPILGV